MTRRSPYVHRTKRHCPLPPEPGTIRFNGRNLCLAWLAGHPEMLPKIAAANMRLVTRALERYLRDVPQVTREQYDLVKNTDKPTSP